MNLPSLQPGAALGKYRIERVLGEGGMGTVLLAHDETLRRRVAIKILGSSDEDDSSAWRLLREARNASALNHPNICTVYEVGEESGCGFIAMEYVDGQPLSELLAGNGPPLEIALQYGIEVADALEHAHDRGVIHRDLKAANTIISSSGRLKIVDFGLARRTDAPADDPTQLRTVTGTVAGTPYAMAPEQVRGLAADARTDVWALGVLLYELLTGGRPFHGSTIGELSSAILSDPPRAMPPALPPILHEIVHKCLLKDPGMRYQRAGEVGAALKVAATVIKSAPRSDGAAAPGSALPPPPVLNVTAPVGFIGRHSELRQAELVWTRVTDRRRQLLLVGGEPGIGKTRFAMELARSKLAAGATVLFGRCDEEALVPYQPFIEALTWYARVAPEPELRAQLAAIGGGGELGPFVPELLRRIPDLPPAPAMNSDAQRYRLFEAVGALLAHASAVRALLLFVDDLHWADKPTLLMLRHIVRAREAASLCLMGTYRESELARTHPFAEMLADLRREETVTRLSLRGLDAKEVGGLVDAFAGAPVSAPIVRAVADSTGGNPFFVGEMLRHLTETGELTRLHGSMSAPALAALGLPEGIKEVIGRRLSRLSEDCNRALGLGAVVGRDFDLAVLEALGDLPEDRLLDSLDEASRAQLVAEAPDAPGRFSFHHALIRETLYGELTSARRVRLHRRVAEAMERLAAGRADPPLADLAYHFVQAASTGVIDKAIMYSIRAGDRAADALALEEAARFYELALQSLDLAPASPETSAQRNELHIRRARAFGALAQWGLQRAELQQALEHLPADQIERRSELLLALAVTSFWLFDIPSVERLASEALQLADDVQRSDIAADAIAWLARCQQAKGDLPAAIEKDRLALARAGSIKTMALAQGPLTLYLAGRNREAVAQASQAAVYARSSRDTIFTMYSLSHLGLALTGSGRYTEAAATFDEVRQFGRKYGVLPLFARATAMSAGFHLSVFDYEGAEALQTEARELGRASFAPTVVSAGIDLVLTLARRHEPSRAEGLLEETASAAARIAGWHDWLWQLRLCEARAELALARGEFEVAVAEATDGIDQCRKRSRPKYEALGLMTRAHAMRGLGRTREAIADARAAVAVARPMEDPALLLQALDVLLGLDGDDQMAREARGLSDRISASFSDEIIRRRFDASEVVQRVRR